MTATVSEERPPVAPVRPRAGVVAPDSSSRRAPGAAEWAAPLLLGAMVGGLVAGRLETGALCLVVASVIAAWVGAPRPSGRWLVTLGSGLAIALVVNLLLIPGRVLAHLPFGLQATHEGLERGIVLALRLAAATVAIHGLRAVWPGERGADEIGRLLRPLERLGLPVSASRMVAGLALRLAPLLGREARRIEEIQRLRAGAKPRGLRARMTHGRAALVPTMVAALERADRVALALEARHYRTRPPAARPAGNWLWPALGLGLVAAALLWRS